MKISLNLPDTLLNKMDAFCKEHDFERSEFVRSLVRERLEPTAIPPKDIPPVTSTIPENIIDDDWMTKSKMSIKGWCQLHFEKGVNYPLQKITWEDENGAVIIDNKFACSKCIEKYQNMGRGKLTFI